MSVSWCLAGVSAVPGTIADETRQESYAVGSEGNLAFFVPIVSVSFHLKVKPLWQNVCGCSWDTRNAKQL